MKTIAEVIDALKFGQPVSIRMRTSTANVLRKSSESSQERTHVPIQTPAHTAAIPYSVSGTFKDVQGDWLLLDAVGDKGVFSASGKLVGIDHGAKTMRVPIKGIQSIF